MKDENPNDAMVRQNLSECVQRLVGNRTLRQVARETGVSVTYISGMIKGRYVPSIGILKKLTDENSNPQNGVIFEDLMAASCYLSKRGQENNETAPYLRKESREQQLEVIRYEKLVPGIIIQALMKNNIMFGVDGDDQVPTTFDFPIKIGHRQIKEWWFEFKYVRGYVPPMQIKRELGKMMLFPPNPELKVSIVVNDKSYFDYLCEFRYKLAYRGEISAVLIDVENCEVTDEVYLSHYELDEYNGYNEDSELYLIDSKEQI